MLHKGFTYKGRHFCLSWKGHGYYSLNGYHFTESWVWDAVLDEEDDHFEEARQRCYDFVMNKEQSILDF